MLDRLVRPRLQAHITDNSLANGKILTSIIAQLPYTVYTRDLMSGKKELMPDCSGIEGKSCWDKAIFANKEGIHQNLVCGIGMGVMESPVRTTCDHLFCAYCIQQVSQCS